MSYKENPLIKVYEFDNGNIVQKAIIDDYEELSITHNCYEAGDFSIQINLNIPNASLFQKNQLLQFGEDGKNIGIILEITDSIGDSGKGSQIRTITGKDARCLFSRRIIKNLNAVDTWSYSGAGELCMRELIYSQCGLGAEGKRRLPIANTIPQTGIGKTYSVSEAYTNLLSVLETIAIQSEVGWGVELTSDGLSLYFFAGTNRSDTVFFSTDMESLRDGTWTESLNSYCNAVYVGGKGSGANRDIYEGEDGEPAGIERFESWDNASSLTEEADYQAEADSRLTEFAQTLSLSGAGLAKCPYVYGEEYDIGDVITLSFSGHTASAQILSVAETWSKGSYGIDFEFGKPVQSLSKQISAILKQIQTYQATADAKKISGIRYYDVATETAMTRDECGIDIVGFTGNIGSSDKTFTLYFDNESKTGARTYHLYIKDLTGTGKLIVSTGISGTSTLELKAGTYVSIVYVDTDGNIKNGVGVDDIRPSSNTTYSSEKIDTTYSSAENINLQLSDLNDVIDEGIYKATLTTWRSCTNLPSDGIVSATGAALLQVYEPVKNGSWRAQVFYSIGTYGCNMYVRGGRLSSGSWTWYTWKKITYESAPALAMMSPEGEE